MANTQTKKREVPPAIKKVLDLDVKLTKQFHVSINRIFNVNAYKLYYKALEISCHGIPWFAFWICFTWLFNDQSLVQMQVNMLLGLVLDIIVVALTKAYTRRRRPVSNIDDALGQIGPDVFSFPSGHATRATLVTYFFLNLHPISIFFAPFLIIWSTAVCISRVLLNRHHILDVVAGIIIGILTGFFLGLIFVEESTAHWIMNALSDEKLDGGEYHV